MKKFLFSVLILVSASSFAVTDSDEIRATFENLKAELLRECKGSNVSHSCAVAGQKFQAYSDKLNKERFDSMEKTDQERMRIQREEIWRQQIRNQNK